ncbi:hypothetical protein V6N11_054548 [Hibiscus sabdariffa]|uniref:RNase H type-1 domain-containing protein n=1 Tax=Hibiscus sabdariffa TaxID=183260 RepID=A0ABR2S4E9_9ROSI
MPTPCPSMSFVTHHGLWDWNVLMQVLLEEILHLILTVYPHAPHLGPDRLGWKDDKNFLLTVNSAYNLLMGHVSNGQEDLIHVLCDCSRAHLVWMQLVLHGSSQIFHSLSLQDWSVHNLDFNGSFPDYVECEDLVVAIKLFREQVTWPILEACREAIYCVIHGDVVQTVNGLVVVIREMLQRPWEVNVEHICRESNMVVSWFAKDLKDQTVGAVFFEEPSDRVQNLFEHDLRCKKGSYVAGIS